MSPARQRAAVLEYGMSPHASLLPPEVMAAARMRIQRRNLLITLALVVVVVVAAYAGVFALAASAQVALTEAQLQTTTLLQEQAKYAPAQVAQTKVSGIQTDQKAVTADEIDWRSYLKTVQRTLPHGASIKNVAVTGDTPISSTANSATPLAATSIANIVLTVDTPGVKDVVGWIGRLSKLDGYVGATPTNITTGEDSGGYEVTLSLAVNDSVVWNRFGSDATGAK